MNSDMTPAIKKRNKFYGLLIIAAIVLPMVLAYLIFKTGIGFPSATSNKGDLLVPPQPIQQLNLEEKDNFFETLYSSDKKRWRILIPVSKVCDETCEAHLYLSRQVHIRLAEKAYRVERVLLLLDPFSEIELDKLKQEHPETLLVQSNTASLNTWLLETKLPASAENYFYLVDQEGFAMMRYNREHSGQDLLDDIKKLLKFTYAK